MRHAGQIKAGFYPCPPEAVEAIASYLIPPAGDFHILDPCAGRGDAIKQFGELLRCRPENIHAVELDEGRAARLKANLPGSQVIAPASFFDTTAKHGSFAFIWCNPPYDDELGAGLRTEELFLARALKLLMPGGVLAMALPEGQAEYNYSLQRQLKTWLDRLALVPYPEAHREYDETVVFGVKRKKMVDPRGCIEYDQDPELYQIPRSGGPGQRFFKSDLTPLEYVRLMDASPLMDHLNPPAESALARPPLAPGVGHLALLLASGYLDGIVQPADEAPHVVRGTARKEQFLKSSVKENLGKGKEKAKEVYSERIVLTVRAITPDGEVRTFTDKPLDEEEQDDDSRAA